MLSRKSSILLRSNYRHQLRKKLVPVENKKLPLPKEGDGINSSNLLRMLLFRNQTMLDDSNDEDVQPLEPRQDSGLIDFEPIMLRMIESLFEEEEQDQEEEYYYNGFEQAARISMEGEERLTSFLYRHPNSFLTPWSRSDDDADYGGENQRMVFSSDSFFSYEIGRTACNFD